MPKPLIAAIHGTAANGAIFKIQLGKFLPSLEEKFDVRFVDGPVVCQPGNKHRQLMEKFFGTRRRGI